MQALLPLLGRILLAAIFLWSAIQNIQQFGNVAKTMGGKNIPIPSLFLVGSIVFLLLGSIALILGIKTRLGALLLILFLIPYTAIYHRPPGHEFLVCLALIGSLCIVIANGAGPISFDGPAPSMKK